MIDRLYLAALRRIRFSTPTLQLGELDPVYTVPDPHGHDIKLNSSTTSVALTLTIVLQDLTTSIHRKKW